MTLQEVLIFLAVFPWGLLLVGIVSVRNMLRRREKLEIMRMRMMIRLVDKEREQLEKELQQQKTPPPEPLLQKVQKAVRWPWIKK